MKKYAIFRMAFGTTALWALVSAHALGATNLTGQRVLRVPSRRFATIQSAIDAAKTRDVIIVSPGIYREDIDFKGKAIKIISTYPKNPAVVALTVIDGSRAGSVVTFQGGEQYNSVLTGFTLRNGAASDGGGIVCVSSSPTITDCVISGNSATGMGGGIACSSSASPSILFCTIRGNSLTSLDTGGGGGIACDFSSPAISYCHICDNSATGSGGGIYCFNRSAPSIVACTVSANSATGNGGGLACVSSAAPDIAYCLISRNSAAGQGGGIYCQDSTVTVTHVTICGNTAASGGGIFCDNCSLPVRSSIIWLNVPDQIAGCPVAVSFSNIQGGYEGTGHIDADPLFVDPGAEDYYLRYGSPCIDAAFDEGTLIENLDGVGESIDGDNDGVAVGDMGAYEYLPGDINRDGLVDHRDLRILRASLGKKAGSRRYNLEADLNGDEVVNRLDYSILTGNRTDTRGLRSRYSVQK